MAPPPAPAASEVLTCSPTAAATIEVAPGLKIAPPPSEYRHLVDGYTAITVAPWAEKRICEVVGSSCLHSLSAFKAGDVLTEFSYKALLNEPNYLTVQVGDASHIMLSPEWLQYINHSCEPNVAFDTAAFVLRALRDIAPGDELCFFYCSTEWGPMSEPFQCGCGTPSCCGRISGAVHMHPDVLRAYWLTEYVAGKLAASSGSASEEEREGGEGAAGAVSQQE